MNDNKKNENDFVDQILDKQNKEERIETKMPGDEKATDLLLNLSFNEESPNQLDDFVNLLDGNDDDGKKSTENILTTDDLLGMNHQSVTLDEKILFEKNPLKPIIMDYNTQSKAKTDFAKSRSYLPRNPSTPNLATSLDPLGDLNNYFDFTNNVDNISSMHRVSSFNVFPKNSINSQTSKPDYSRHNFTEITSNHTGLRGPKVNGNEFEDLLGGFKKKSNESNIPKSLAQIRKQDMV